MSNAMPDPLQPAFRRLRLFSLDPSLRRSLETAVINQATVSVPWEQLEVGPVGEYVEVVDYDPPSGRFYEPVDLEDRFLLAQDGLRPSEGDPKFHQQMVYAVAMMTIRNFERALGRVALWATKKPASGRGSGQFVQRLRIYPHALREANAYYSPAKKALLFGYFPADPATPGSHMPGGMVFSCLSHDIIAHETAHALLDGLHRRFIEATNRDVLAFHEAFADIVALLQHFSMPEVLEHQIARTCGDLTTRSLLGELASEFGKATGSHGGLRDAIGEFDEETGEWTRQDPDPAAYRTVREPHARGALLVAAVFDAFLAIYDRRTADLFRIASGGTGIMPEGNLHPDLVNRLAREAAKAAQHVLNISIRALDYCPPFDVTFGEYLRAMITADRDLVPDDPLGYRVALIEAFRRRGIFPEDVLTMSEESLVWRQPTPYQQGILRRVLPSLEDMKSHMPEWDLSTERQAIHKHTELQRKEFRDSIRASEATEPPDPTTRTRRRRAYGMLGMDLSLRQGDFEVHSLRPARRIGPNGESIVELVVELTQKRPMFIVDGEPELPSVWTRRQARKADAWFRGGCTLLIDIRSGQVRYLIHKSIGSKRRQKRQAAFQKNKLAASLRATYMRSDRPTRDEPFALLHRYEAEEFKYD